MLEKVGKWLRIAGYDTKMVVPGMEDRQILIWALEENRLLLTRDRHFLEMKKASGILIFLSANSIEMCIQELNKQLKIDWFYAPFSRCIVCNALLVKPEEKTILEKAPPGVCEHAKQFWYCPHCQKLYWLGSHTKEMLKQLNRWQIS